MLTVLRLGDCSQRLTRFPGLRLNRIMVVGTFFLECRLGDEDYVLFSISSSRVDFCFGRYTSFYVVYRLFEAWAVYSENVKGRRDLKICRSTYGSFLTA